MMSRQMKKIVLLVNFPWRLSSVLRCGFQWGTRSKAKWEATAKGRARAGLPTLAAITDPTTACGNSSMGNANDIICR